MTVDLYHQKGNVIATGGNNFDEMSEQNYGDMGGDRRFTDLRDGFEFDDQSDNNSVNYNSKCS